MSNLSELLPAGAGAKSAEFVASGTLGSGVTVALKADGTVEAVGLVSGLSVLSSTFMPSTGTIGEPAIEFDPSNGSKFALVYGDGANSNYGTAVIGTVSGSTITFGTPVVFLSSYYASGKESLGYSADGTKIVINIRDFGNANYGSVRAASVSGTTLTFGTASIYQSNTTYNPSLACDPFDSTKLVFSYRNAAAGSIGQARAGTLSGTSVSYGSAVTFNNATTYDTALSYNPNEQNKFMIVWNDTGSFSASIGTVSGTSISFGAETTLASNGVSALGMSFDPASGSNKAVAVMEDTTNGKGKAVVCSVSGSTITVGSTVEFYSSDPAYVDVSFSGTVENEFYVAYRATTLKAHAIRGTISGTTCSFANDTEVSSGNSFYVTASTSISGNIFIGYRDNSVTSRGVIAACNNESLNNTSFIGITDQAIADTATGAVIVQGGVSDKVTGLTTGSDYYVQADGTISTTVSSVPAGRALSSTSILLEG